MGSSWILIQLCSQQMADETLFCLTLVGPTSYLDDDDDDDDAFFSRGNIQTSLRVKKFGGPLKTIKNFDHRLHIQLLLWPHSINLVQLDCFGLSNQIGMVNTTRVPT